MSIHSQQFEGVFGTDSDDETILNDKEMTVDLDVLIQKLVELRKALRQSKVPVYKVEFGGLTPIHTITVGRKRDPYDEDRSKAIVVID
jgi:hypothetical protein